MVLLLHQAIYLAQFMLVHCRMRRTDHAAGVKDFTLHIFRSQGSQPHKTLATLLLVLTARLTKQIQTVLYKPNKHVSAAACTNRAGTVSVLHFPWLNCTQCSEGLEPVKTIDAAGSISAAVNLPVSSKIRMCIHCCVQNLQRNPRRQQHPRLMQQVRPQQCCCVTFIAPC